MISILIPETRPCSPSLRAILDYTRRRWRHLFPEAEVIVASDGYDGTDRPWNKSRAINNAARVARGDHFLIADPEVFYQLRDVPTVEKYVTTTDFYIPCHHIGLISPSGTARVLQGPPTMDPSFFDTEVEALGEPCGFIQIFSVSRSAFERIHGMNESITDCELAMRWALTMLMALYGGNRFDWRTEVVYLLAGDSAHGPLAKRSDNTPEWHQSMALFEHGASMVAGTPRRSPERIATVELLCMSVWLDRIGAGGERWP